MISGYHMLSGLRRWSGCFGEERNLFLAPGIEHPIHPSSSQWPIH